MGSLGRQCTLALTTLCLAAVLPAIAQVTEFPVLTISARQPLPQLQTFPDAVYLELVPNEIEVRCHTAGYSAGFLLR